MTLRADITAAYDEIAPAAPELEGQIRMMVTDEAKGASQTRGRRGPWLKSLRGTMALVAALLVVLIVAAVLVGGRVWQDWNVFNNRPAPAGHVPVTLAQLESRPLHLTAMAADGGCPAGPFKTIDYGSGHVSAYSAAPAYGIGGPSLATDWGYYFDVKFVTEPQVTGLVLVRGRDAANHALPVVYVGPYAAGPVVGTDIIDGKPVEQHAELVIDASKHPSSSGKSKWGIWNVRQGISTNGWSGCTAFQVDGDGFSKVFSG